jgi:hypothetical protein
MFLVDGVTLVMGVVSVVPFVSRVNVIVSTVVECEIGCCAAVLGRSTVFLALFSSTFPRSTHFQLQLDLQPQRVCSHFPTYATFTFQTAPSGPCKSPRGSVGLVVPRILHRGTSGTPTTSPMTPLPALKWRPSHGNTSSPQLDNKRQLQGGRKFTIAVLFYHAQRLCFSFG